MVVQNAVEGSIYTIIDVVHVGKFSTSCIFLLEPLADHIHSNSVSGTCKIAT